METGNSKLLKVAHDLEGFTIHASDGDIGSLDDIYFDDQSWDTRYLVVDTGKWLFGRKVLLYPFAVNDIDWDNSTFNLALTKEQVQSSPEIDSDKPVTRQHQMDLHLYYDWPMYWDPGYISEPMEIAAPPEIIEDEIEEIKKQGGDVHLRSINAVSGYHIHATDGEIGHVEDFILDYASWKVRYLVVDTRNWLPGKKVLIATPMVKKINYTASEINVDMTREKIKNSPEFEYENPLDRVYEELYYDYYQMDRYW